MNESGIQHLMLAFYRRLLRPPWACLVIGLQAPRGPSYLRLSERMCSLLADLNVPDPLST